MIFTFTPGFFASKFRAAVSRHATFAGSDASWLHIVSVISPAETLALVLIPMAITKAPTANHRTVPPLIVFIARVLRLFGLGPIAEVVVDLVMTEGERKVMINLQRKAKAADKMFDNLVHEMNNAMGILREDKIINEMRHPQWL